MNYDPTGSVFGTQSTTSPKDLIKLQILARRENLIEAFEHHDRIDAAGAAGFDHIVRARFKSYYRQLLSYLHVNADKEKCTSWWNAITKGDIEEMHTAYTELDQFLYIEGLLNFENTLRPSRPTAEGWNKERGMG